MDVRRVVEAANEVVSIVGPFVDKELRKGAMGAPNANAAIEALAVALGSPDEVEEWLGRKPGG